MTNEKLCCDLEHEDTTEFQEYAVLISKDKKGYITIQAQFENTKIKKARYKPKSKDAWEQIGEASDSLVTRFIGASITGGGVC